ncbi:MAG: alkaline phosphatase family protein [Oceanospirillaceae bacterium]|nr:alkaline phosphatase family protein [Oceanospirillaceae bacterium]
MKFYEEFGAKQLNILFITADQWRGDCLGVAGHPQLKTPHLDALAADGCYFKQHFAQAVPCGPSRTCLYTGMYLNNHRSLLNGTPLDARHTNVALEARKAGYAPALFGYTDVGLDPRQFHPGDTNTRNYEGVLPGMDPVVHVDGLGLPWLAFLKEKGYETPNRASKMMAPAGGHDKNSAKGKTFAPAAFKAEHSRSAFLVDEAIRYLSVREQQSWFVHLSFLSPHPPYIAPEPYNSQYKAEDMPLPTRRSTLAEEASQHPWLKHYLYNQKGDNYTAGANSADNPTLSDLELRQTKATYLGMMSEIDDQLGRLFQDLKQRGVYEDTLIIFTSDHGDLMGDHWMFSKSSYYEQAFHVPLIVRHPKARQRGAVVEAFTESVDIMPTILESLQLSIPRQCDGRSLLPFLHGDTPANWRQEYHAEFDLRCPNRLGDAPPLGLKIKQCGVNIIRGERYKYVHFNGLPALFFDLQEDPNEQQDLSGDPKYQSLILEFTHKLLNWRMEHDEPSLTHLYLHSDGVVEHLDEAV